MFIYSDVIYLVVYLLYGWEEFDDYITQILVFPLSYINIIFNIQSKINHFKPHSKWIY